VKFIEAKKILATASGGEALSFCFGMSATSDQIILYLQAIAAKRGWDADITTLPFGTLLQSFYSPPTSISPEILLLMPWDLVPECDWRSGFPTSQQDSGRLIEKAKTIADKIKHRPNAQVLFLSAPIPPIFSNHVQNKNLAFELINIARDLGAQVLDETYFNLMGYLTSGNACNSSKLYDLAEIAIDMVTGNIKTSAKILVTDLDGVMWSGVVAEDGVEGIYFEPEGTGYPHFLYQSFLNKLVDQGILVAAVSRNDEAVAWSPFKTLNMLFPEKNMVALRASYDAKSIHIRALAEDLNLRLESFVFVDDNPVEIAEVSAALPEVICVKFPTEQEFPSFLNTLNRLFSRTELTDEDKNRTDLYRIKNSSKPKNFLEGVDLSYFLKQLNMTLELKIRTTENFGRAIQLINKTNQFNINGKKVNEETVSEIITSGGKLITGTLSDNSGTHGEVLVCLIDSAGCIISFVMSCRVFQRRAEFVFLCWILETQKGPLCCDYCVTEKNLPLLKFLDAAAISHEQNGKLLIDSQSFISKFSEDKKLFTLV